MLIIIKTERILEPKDQFITVNYYVSSFLQSAAKRYKVTGSGRVVVRHAGKNQ